VGFLLTIFKIILKRETGGFAPLTGGKE